VAFLIIITVRDAFSISPSDLREQVSQSLNHKTIKQVNGLAGSFVLGLNHNLLQKKLTDD
jgi:hypothetical protein